MKTLPLLLSLLLPASLSFAGQLVLTGARLWDGTGHEAVDDATLVIENGRITAVGKLDATNFTKQSGEDWVELKGKYVIPGLISDHSHLGLVRRGKVSPDNYTRETVENAVRQYEGYGITAVLSLGLNKDALYTWRDQQRQGNFPGADIFTADRGLGVMKAAPPVPLGGDQLDRPQSAEEARQCVREMVARHPDIIKLWVDDFFGTVEPKMSPEIYQAIIEEAHRQGIRVAAHVFHLEDAKLLLKAGLDIVAHSVRDAPVDPEFIDLLKKNHGAYIATLALDESQYIYAEHPAWMDGAAFRAAVDPTLRDEWLSPTYVGKIRLNPQTALNRAAHAQAMQNVKRLFDAGILVGFGTDSGAMPTRIPGWAEHRELQLLVEAGLTPAEALQCATRNAAQVLGDAQNRGTLEPGKRADFVVLDADPLADIHNTTHLAAIYHGGRRIAPAYDNEPAGKQGER